MINENPNENDDKNNSANGVNSDRMQPSPVNPTSYNHSSKIKKMPIKIGHLFQEARKIRKVSLEEVAAKLRIKVEYLLALENDDYASLPSNTFVKGYVRSYAIYLRIDNEDLNNKLSLILKNRPEKKHFPTVGVVKPVIYKENWVILGFAATAFFLLVLTSLIWFGGHPSVSDDDDAIIEGLDKIVEEQAQAIESEQSSGNSITKKVSGDVGQTIGLPDEGNEIKVSPERAIERDAVDTKKQSEQKFDKNPELSAASYRSRLRAFTNDRINVTFEGNCWVQVSDRMGNVIYSSLHKGDSVMKLTGKAPFNIVFGDISVVRSITFNDQELPLESKQLLGDRRRNAQQVARLQIDNTVLKDNL